MNETLVDQLARAAQIAPHARVYCNDEEFGYADILERSLRCAQALRRLGIGGGDRVALWLPNSRAYLDLLYACFHIGAIAVAVNTRFRAAETQSILQRTGAKALAIWPDFNGIDFLQMLRSIDPEGIPALETVLVCHGEPISPWIKGLAVVSHDHLLGDSAGLSAAAPHLPAAIFATSGTTSIPKFALHKQAAIARHAAQVSAVCRYGQEKTHLMQAIPFCGIFGFSQWMAAVAGAACCTIISAFDAAEAGRLIRLRNVNHVHGPDDLLKRLLDAFPNEEKPFPSLRSSVYAGFNPTLADFPSEAERRGIHLIGAFGMSEIYSFFSLQPLDAPLSVRARSGGIPVNPNARVRARDAATGTICTHGALGELEILSDTLFSEYFKDPSATTAAFTDDGYFKTGDLGSVSADGSLRFFGRIGDFLRLGGFLVNPIEIETAIQKQPFIETAVVVEVPTSRGNKPIAFVKLRNAPGFDESCVRQALSAQLADYKVPLRVIAVDIFPTAMGPNGEKIQRTKLKEQAKQYIPV